MDTAEKISIHAPHAGCDRLSYDTYITDCLFQSTHPMRGATDNVRFCMLYLEFQSTHPMRGATRHPLGRGCSNADFNPRTPCGVRPENHAICFVGINISIHAPHAGCDVCLGHQAVFRLDISIHAPHAGCDFVILVACFALCISIHAPHAGCDDCILRSGGTPALFQSTHPMRGATHCLPAGMSADWTISIHAPHAGCDRRVERFDRYSHDFNPRTPCGVRQVSRINK